MLKSNRVPHSHTLSMFLYIFLSAHTCDNRNVFVIYQIHFFIFLSINNFHSLLYKTAMICLFFTRLFTSHLSVLVIIPPIVNIILHVPAINKLKIVVFKTFIYFTKNIYYYFYLRIYAHNYNKHIPATAFLTI